ncbi:MAG: hypothetical protein D3917_12535 [Candidatus Electrothrix sp. AX5]|nr:hypothetical protein [Candidatus Electrothrix sp. AX5]
MKYTEISDIHRAADFFNECARSINTSTPYRVIESEEDRNIITNVPPAIYNDTDLRKYLPPDEELSSNSNNFVSFLHQGFDFFHNNDPEAHLKYEDGKIFHYNKCYDNSLAAYFCLLNLSKNNNLPITGPICICLGFLSREVSLGAGLSNAVINVPNMIVHDWHVWNKINSIIIDLSIIKHGGVFSLGTKELKWGKAEDHVFKYPPENTVYYGIDFDDDPKFTNYIKKLFDN